MGVDASRPQSRQYIVQDEDARTPISVISRGIEGHHQQQQQQQQQINADTGKPKPRLFSIIKGKLYSLEGKPGLIQQPNQLNQFNTTRKPDFPPQNFQRVDLSNKMDPQPSEATKPPQVAQSLANNEINMNGRPSSGLAPEAARPSEKPVPGVVQDTVSSVGKPVSPLRDNSKVSASQDKHEPISQVKTSDAKEEDDTCKPETYSHKMEEVEKQVKDEIKSPSSNHDAIVKEDSKIEQLYEEGKASSRLLPNEQEKPSVTSVASEKNIIEGTDKTHVDSVIGRFNAEDCKQFSEITSLGGGVTKMNSVKEDIQTHLEKDVLFLETGQQRVGVEKDNVREDTLDREHRSPKSEILISNGEPLVNGHITEESPDELKSISKDISHRTDQKPLSDNDIITAKVSTSPIVPPSPKTANGPADEVIAVKTVLNETPKTDLEKPNDIAKTDVSAPHSVPVKQELESTMEKSQIIVEPEASITEEKVSAMEELTKMGDSSSPAKEKFAYSAKMEDKPSEFSPVPSAKQEIEAGDERHSIQSPRPEDKTKTDDTVASVVLATPPPSPLKHQEPQSKTKTTADQKHMIFESKFSEDLRFETLSRETSASTTRTGSGDSVREINGQVAMSDIKMSPAVSKSPSPRPPSVEETTVVHLEAEPSRPKSVLSQLSKSPSPEPDRERPVSRAGSKTPVQSPLPNGDVGERATVQSPLPNGDAGGRTSMRSPLPSGDAGGRTPVKSPVPHGSAGGRASARSPLPSGDAGRRTPVKSPLPRGGAGGRPPVKSPLPNGDISTEQVSPAEEEAKKPALPASAKKERNLKENNGASAKEEGKSELIDKQPGDRDSEVDDSPHREAPTTNGDIGSPQKSPSKLPTKKPGGPVSPSKSPSKSSSSSSRSASKLPTAEPAPAVATAPATATDKKKVPMNKVQVGGAPSPNLKTVRSKIGSLENTSYKPGGGKIKIEHRKLDFSKTQPKIAAKNDAYVPGGGDKKITQVKLQWNAKPKVGSLDNATHKPGGGDKKIESVKLDFKDKAKPKIGSKDNVKYQPGGGAIKNSSSAEEEISAEIEDQKLEVKAQSKVGSLSNVKHKPGGGEKKIFDDKDYLKQVKTGSVASSEGRASGAQTPEPSSPSHHSSQHNVSEEPQQSPQTQQSQQQAQES